MHELLIYSNIGINDWNLILINTIFWSDSKGNSKILHLKMPLISLDILLGKIHRFGRVEEGIEPQTRLVVI